jgi:hypothetical protein
MTRLTPRLYFASYRWLGQGHRLIDRLYRGLRAGVAGVWLGLLRRDTLLQIDQIYYRSKQQYTSDEYNRQGLWQWEQEMIARYFNGRHHLLLIGAGGGREVLALSRRGHLVRAVECNPELVTAANRLLSREAVLSMVECASPDSAPVDAMTYDGVIVGWGAYMLIQGRARRIALLRSLRGRIGDGSPLLISFFARPAAAARLRLTAAIANLLRRTLRREPVEVGDTLEPEYVHYFTQQEVAAEMREAGFSLRHYGAEPYGHAIGIATGAAAAASPAHRMSAAATQHERAAEVGA